MNGTGVWRRAELIGRLGGPGLREAVRVGSVARIRHGWYARPTAHPDVVTAVRAGGHLGCLSGCRFYGLWVPPDPQVHVTFNRQVPESLPTDVAAHHDREIGREPAVRSLISCLEEVVRHHSTETALIVLDSALNLGLIAESDVVALVTHCPIPKHRVLRYIDGRAQSGTETRVRYYFQRRRVPVEAQVQVPGVGWIDLQVGRSLMIECDSRAHHTGVENYQRDRRRDLILTVDGRRVLRLSYEQVFLEWPATRRMLSRLVQARMHRRPPLSATEESWLTHPPSSRVSWQ